MAKHKRIFEIARELGVKSKAVLDKCRAEGVDVKNHMSAVSAGLEASIREWFSEEAGGGTAVEEAGHIDVAKEREAAKKARRRRKAKPEEPVEEEKSAAEAEAPPTETEVGAEGEPAEHEEEATEQPAEETTAAVAEQPPETAEAETKPAEEEKPPEQKKPPKEEKPAKAKKPPKEEPEEEPREEPEEKPKEEIKPAGPKVVPERPKLKGPRVVRVEKPEPARPRRKPLIPLSSMETDVAGPKKGKGKKGGPRRKEGEGKKPRRRSPRRRGGRSAASGEGIKEWRDRDLQERSQRLAAATGGTLRRRRASMSSKSTESRPSVKPGKVEIEEPITVKSLSAATGIKTADIIKNLMKQGTMATANQSLPRDLAESVAMDFDIELVVRRAKTAEEELYEEFEARKRGKEVPRPAAVTFLGHVDHGKTSLLDRIRETSVVSGESGGITQHIGAYRYDVGGKQVVFLDTPGHEAFTEMRARGASITDVVVLVVAADDGVMPQTVEAINHAKAAKVPIVVALNKMDLPGANVDRVLGQLAEHGLNPQRWGGEVEVIQTSAETGQGIDELVETLSLEAEILELKADAEAPASGYIVEARQDPGLGPLATLLVRDGELNVGDIVLAGVGYGRVRQMNDDRGNSIEKAGPSTPAEVAGLDEVPQAGDRFMVVEDIEKARQVAEDRRQRARSEELAETRPATLEDLLGRIQAGEKNEVSLIVKADTQGSVEAVCSSLEKIQSEEVGVNIIHSAVGAISTGDVTLAEASEALIIGFNISTDPAARSLAEQKGVDIRLYSVIYEAIDDIRKVVSEGLAPEVRQETVGRAEVRQVFKISRLGTIAGCYVTDGQAERNAKVRVIRDGKVVVEERDVDSLKRFKNDARQVRNGMECGVKVAGYDDLKEGDVLEFYRHVEVARTLPE